MVLHTCLQAVGAVLWAMQKAITPSRQCFRIKSDMVTYRATSFAGRITTHITLQSRRVLTNWPAGHGEISCRVCVGVLLAVLGRFSASPRCRPGVARIHQAASARSNVGSSMVAGCILSQNSPSRPRLLSHHQTTHADFLFPIPL